MGGAEWGGPAIDRKSGVMYVNTNNIACTGALTDNSTVHGAGMTVYLSQCAVCHGAVRRGAPPEFPSLVGITGQADEPADCGLRSMAARGACPRSRMCRAIFWWRSKSF